MIVAINFADPGFSIAQKLNSKTAIRYGADRVIEYGPRDIDDDFYNKNRNIFERKRGYGYWLWKPYFILKTLKKISDGDYLVYSDSGTAYVNKISLLIENMRRDSVDIMPFCIDQYEIEWNKRDALIILDADKEEILKSNQICGTYSIYKKSPNTVSVMEEYLGIIQDTRILTDDPNVMGYDNYPEFIEHRHDQSVWSLFCKKKGIKPYRDPSQFGNDDAAFSEEVVIRSVYPQIFECHRRKDIKYQFELEYYDDLRSAFLREFYNNHFVKKIRIKLKGLFQR